MLSMAEIDDYVENLGSALTAQRNDLENTVIPRLKEHYRRIRSNFEAMYTVIKKKGLIKDDPYNYEERLSDLDVPDDLPMLDSERDKELGIRLGKYKTRIEYLTDYADYSLDSLSLRKLKLLVKFSRFLNWSGMSEASTRPTTRAFAELLGKIKRSTDQFSINVVKDGQEQLNKVQNALTTDLKRISIYKKEEYKYAIRTEVLPHMRIPDVLDRGQYENAAQQVRKILPRYLPGVPFARDLVLEIFSENDPETGPPARSALLDALAIAEKPKESAKKGPDPRVPLWEGARTLAGSSRPMEDVVKKLNDNLVVFESRKLSFGEVMRRVWDRLRGKDAETHTFEIEYIDETTNARTTESLPFEQFLSNVMRRVRIYNGILSKGGPGWAKLQSTGEEELLDFLTKEFRTMIEMVRRFESLDTFFQSEVPREQRSQLRGTNAEVVMIRDGITRARKKVHEYVAKKEEADQLKKLGISPQAP